MARSRLAYELVVMPLAEQLRGAVPAPELFVRRRDEFASPSRVILRREESHRGGVVFVLVLVAIFSLGESPRHRAVLLLPRISPLERHLLPRELSVRLAVLLVLTHRTSRASSRLGHDPLNLPPRGSLLPPGDEWVRVSGPIRVCRTLGRVEERRGHGRRPHVRLRLLLRRSSALGAEEVADLVYRPRPRLSSPMTEPLSPRRRLVREIIQDLTKSLRGLLHALRRALLPDRPHVRPAPFSLN